jgi:alkyl sulfatase BDS1-like metallo-beta-lactamase superfamily hydrolase
MKIRLVFAALGLLLALGCGREPARDAAGPDAAGATAASVDTAEANRAVASALALEDPQDFDDARRGLVAGDPAVLVRDAAGRTIWDTSAYGFVAGDAPASVNPSLWRQAKLNGIHGLFEVVPGVHQVRGYDLSNLTLIDGATGWIAVDPLTSQETAAAALALARRHLGPKPVVAVIFTHSHVDHFGGAQAMVPEAPAARAALRVVAPLGFLEEATSENVLAGVGMGRRSAYMYGFPLPRSPFGHVDTGLGKAPARGTISILPPTDVVDRTPQEIVLDGVRFVFQYAPHSEAPTELTFYLPDRKAFCAAEIATHTLHNLYTLRGAKIRDALAWSGAIDASLQLFGDAEVLFGSHHWPVWGNERVRTHLERQRDLYRYLHDQTLRLANAGATPQEIAEQLELPPSLAMPFANRGYYGTVRHDAKAIYQAYFGWYDGNPAHLDPLPPVEAGKRYVAAMGGADAVLAHAREALERGDHRWVAMLLDHLVFAEPGNDAARELLAQAYDQLGYRAESGPWRDAYLTGAFELRHGVAASELDLASATGLLRELSLDQFFASLATRLDGPRAAGERTRLNFVFSDVGESYVIELSNGVLHHRRADPAVDAAATVHLTRDFLIRLATRQAGLRELIFSEELSVDGSRLALLGFFALLDRPQGDFAIVTP